VHVLLRLAAASALLGINAAFLPLPAQTPTSVDQIPVYPGATRQPDREAEVYGTPGPGQRIYRVRAPIEDVVRFYQQRLQAREVRSEDERSQARDTYERIPAGKTSGAVMLLDPVDLTPAHFAETAGADENPAQLAAAWRAAYTQKRTPFRPNTWIHVADFEWGAMPSAGQPVEFYLSLEDVGAWQIRETGYFHETEIGINAQGTGPVAEERQEEEEEAPVAPMAAPSAAQLGVPLYPGAKFDGRLSAEMSRSDEEGIFYVYSSADTPQQVTAFYQTRTGKKGITTESGTMIAVKGEGLFPELGVTIQPNAGTFAAPAKTMLTIYQKR
jgi:hypothetical protein